MSENVLRHGTGAEIGTSGEPIENMQNIKNDLSNHIVEDLYYGLNSGVFEGQFSRETNDHNIRVFKDLSTNHYRHICIIGLGGIGSWMAFFLSKFFGKSNESGRELLLSLFDPDEVSMSNLNRSCFDYSDVGSMKVNAVASKIMAMNSSNIQVLSFAEKYDHSEFEKFCLENELDFNDEFTLFLDCRDDLIHDIPSPFHVVKTSYNKSSITIDFNPRTSFVFGRAGYEIVNSHMIPSCLSALLTLLFVTRHPPKFKNNMMDENSKEGIQIFQNEPKVTFDCAHIETFLYFLNMFERIFRSYKEKRINMGRSENARYDNPLTFDQFTTAMLRMFETYPDRIVNLFEEAYHSRASLDDYFDSLKGMSKNLIELEVGISKHVANHHCKK